MESWKIMKLIYILKGIDMKGNTVCPDQQNKEWILLSKIAKMAYSSR